MAARATAAGEPLAKSVQSWLDQAEAAVVAAEAGGWEQVVAAVDARATRAALVLRDLPPRRLARLSPALRLSLLAVVTDPRISFPTEPFILPAAQALLDSLPLPQATLDARLAAVDAFASEIKAKPELAADRAVFGLHDDAGKTAALSRAAARFAALIGLDPVPGLAVIRQGWNGRHGGPVTTDYAKGAYTLTVNLDPHGGLTGYDQAVIALAAALIRHQQRQTSQDRIQAIMTRKAPPLPADSGDRLLHLSARCPTGHGPLVEVDRRPHAVCARAMEDRLRRHLAPGLFARPPKPIGPKA